MQCAKCDSPIELTPSGEPPATCPKCGAPLAAGAAARGRRGSWTAVFVLLLVGLAAIAAGSIMFAMRTVEQRDRAQEAFARSASALDETVASAAGSGRLKGPPAAQAREEVFQPAIKYYQDTVATYENDEQMLPEVVEAQFRLASLQAKTGSADCVGSLISGLRSLNQMIKADYPEESYPGFQAIVLKITEPMDWVSVKTDDLPAHGLSLYLAIQTATGAYRDLVKKFPDSVAFRDDHAALLRSGAALIALVPARASAALGNWIEARDVLETLVRDEPSNADYQARLAESLEAAADIQKSQDETDAAIANYGRAVEVRQKMAEASPDDKGLEQRLAKVKDALAALESTQADPKPDAPKEADADTVDDAPPQETPQADDGRKDDAGEPETEGSDAPAAR
jgi:tetratricopeptide (TPR) repeat protein